MALMTSIAMVAWARLDFLRWDFGNWLPTMVFYICALTAFFSLYANLSSFLDKAFDPPFALGRVARKLKGRGYTMKRTVLASIVLVWRSKPFVCVEVLVVGAVVYAAVIAATMLAASVAIAALKNRKRWSVNPPSSMPSVSSQYSANI